MGQLGFKTQAQQEAQVQEATKQEVSQFNQEEQQPQMGTVAPAENMTNLHSETQDRVNQTFDFILGADFQGMAKEDKANVLNNFRYYSQIEAKLQLLK